MAQVTLWDISCAVALAGAAMLLSTPAALAARAEVKELNGAPALFIDGRPSTGLMFSSGPDLLPHVAGGELHLANRPGYYGGRSTRSAEDFGADFTLEATLTAREVTGSGGNVALWVNETEAGSYYLALAEVDDKRVVALWKAGPGAWTFDKWITHEFPWQENEPVRLRLGTKAGRLSLSVDGEPVGETVDPQPLPPGPLKISVYHTRGSVADLRVTRPDGAVVLEDTFDAARPDVWRGVVAGDVPGFENVGFDIAMVDLRLSQYWTGPERHDLTAVEQLAEGFARTNPNSRLFVRVVLNPPEWWIQAHPEDIAVWRRPRGGGEGKLRYASFSSPTWRKDTGEALRTVLAHILSGPHSDRFIGFNLLYAFGPEWEHPCVDAFHDYSPVNLEQFRSWLRTQYADDARLAAAWHEPDVTFDTATVPPPDDRVKGDFYELLDPTRRGAHIAEYIRFTDESVVEAIAYMASIVKAATQRQAVVVAHYGYHFEGYDGFDRINYNERGHHAISRFLALQDIDGSGSAYQYRVRQAGGATVPITTVGSLRLHGKLYWLEDDTRTHLSSPTSSYGRARNLWESVNILKRNAAEAISQGMPSWYLDFEGNWFSQPEIMAALKSSHEIAEEALTRDRRRNSEIAVIVSQRTVRYLRSSTALWLPLLCHEFFEELPHVGAPFDSYVIEDLARPDMPEYKLYLLLDAFALDDQERQLLREKVLCRGHTVLWHYAPGYITDEGFSDEAMSEITGMKLAALDMGGVPRATLCDLSHPATRSCPPGLSWGPKLPLGPIITCEDPDAHVLGMQHAVPGMTPGGHFKMGDVFEPAVTVKPMEDWTSVWCGVAPVPSSLLRGIAQMAGVHIYSDAEDALSANNSMVAVHARYAGPRTIRLPRTCRVVDAFTGEQVADHARSFTVSLRQYETRMWWLE